MLYVCVFVCLLMKGSFSFDPNDAKFTQKIDEWSGRAVHYILPNKCRIATEIYLKRVRHYEITHSML